VRRKRGAGVPARLAVVLLCCSCMRHLSLKSCAAAARPQAAPYGNNPQVKHCGSAHAVGHCLATHRTHIRIWTTLYNIINRPAQIRVVQML
jgi:hypothetical protein